MAQPAPAETAILRLTSRETFSDDLAYFGRTVGPRRGKDKRNHRQKENYCLRRWLVAMYAADRLQFPIEVAAVDRGAPDFLMNSGESRVLLGIEVTEAGSANWQSWLTKNEGSGTGAIMDNEDGYAGDAAEQTVAYDIAERLREKSEQYGNAKQWDLLVYENSEGGLLSDHELTFRILRDRYENSVGAAKAAFRQVHLIFGDTVYLDLFGPGQLAVAVSQQHADDWSGWLLAQAKRLRERDLSVVDADHLAEELESLGRSEQRALKSHVRRLLVHLLKWKFQQSRRGNSWRNSIESSRDEIEDILVENPSLENRLLALIEEEYPRAVREAATETSVLRSQFPDTCPFTVDEMRDPAFLPEQ